MNLYIVFGQKLVWDVVNFPTRTYLGLLSLHGLFSIPSPAPLGKIIHSGKFNQGGENKGVAHGDEPVHGSGICHLRQGVSSTDAESGHGEHCGHTWRGKETGSILLVTLAIQILFQQIKAWKQQDLDYCCGQVVQWNIHTSTFLTNWKNSAEVSKFW